MSENQIREYILVKDDVGHAKLEEVGCYEYYEDLRYMDSICDMLNRTFKINSLLTEASYVIAFDHKSVPKGICKVGQGGLTGAPLPMQPVFTFLLLTGASSFILVHNHISDMPEASEEDKKVTAIASVFSHALEMEFIGHMIINPYGYIIDGGIMSGAEGMIDEDGDVI